MKEGGGFGDTCDSSLAPRSPGIDQLTGELTICHKYLNKIWLTTQLKSLSLIQHNNLLEGVRDDMRSWRVKEVKLGK